MFQVSLSKFARLKVLSFTNLKTGHMTFYRNGLVIYYRHGKAGVLTMWANMYTFEYILVVIVVFVTRIVLAPFGSLADCGHGV